MAFGVEGISLCMTEKTRQIYVCSLLGKLEGHTQIFYPITSLYM